jgi:hypothetical protein
MEEIKRSEANGLADSPVGLAAWMRDHDIRSYGTISRVFDGKTEGLTRDDVLDNVTLYWLTNTRDLLGAPLLGHHADFDRRRFLRRQGRHDAGRGERFPRRNLCGPEKLGGAGVSQAHLLQQARQRRSLRGVGTAAAVQRRNAGGVQIAAIAQRIVPPVRG